MKLLWFLTEIRHDVSENFIIKQNLASKEDIDHLKSRMVLAGESGFVYLKDYIKNELLTSIEPESQMKVHNYLKDLYESQLPKKPSARDLLISRATMRRETEYHINQVLILKSGNNLQPQHGEKVGFNYLSYARAVTYDWNFQSTPIAFTNVPDIPASRQQSAKKRQFELTEEEFSLLTAPSEQSEIIYEPMTAENEQHAENDLKTPIVSSEISIVKTELESCIEKAQNCEILFDYASAVDAYRQALLLKNDDLFDVKQPIIMTKLAFCYKKMQDYTNAIEQFEKVYDVYIKNEPIKANYILLNIAQTYNETYKFVFAKKTYDKILNSNIENPTALLVRVYLDLAEIEDNSSNVIKAKDYAMKALLESDKIDDLSLKGEVYFKYALFLDDSGRFDEAFMYYMMCIEISKDPGINVYLSSAYSNLAGIYFERNSKSKAVEYYEKAIEVDKAQNNFEGLYFGYTKLAHLLQASSPDSALENLVKALGAARRLDDGFYAASVYLDLGDFYYNRKTDAKALKAYFQARRLIMKQPNEENIQKVNTRINDLKVRLGSSRFAQLIEEFKKK